MYRFMTIFMALTAFTAAAHAGNTTYHVTWDTRALASGDFDPAGSGSYYFFTQLSNGDGTYGDNSVAIGPVDLGGGTERGTYLADGGVSGSLTTGLTLTDTEFSNAYAAKFSAGSHFNFDLTVSSEYDGQFFPDQFSFGLFYYADNLLEIPTLDPLGNGSFLLTDLGGIPPLYRGGPNVFYTFDSFPSTATGSVVPAPVLTVTYVQETPEPAALWLAAAGVAGLLWWRRRASI